MTLVCFSHLRWDFVFQRPQHLMALLARDFPVIFWEEPVRDPTCAEPVLNSRSPFPNVTVVAPHLPEGLSAHREAAALRALLDTCLAVSAAPLIRWYYTPMMLPFSRHLAAACTIYDCMDELANFRFAPPDLGALEAELLSAADLVFTGGHSLYEAKCGLHHAVHAFPSSVDAPHFAQARRATQNPPDQAGLPGPRLGFYGVIDERMDLDLLAAVADARPEWSLVMVGPVVKIDPADLPRRPNIAYLGGKTYDQLPLNAGGWDVALMPFAINPSTQFISPTKTPEYLAAGLPIVSTPITDVVRQYGAIDAVSIAATPEAFVVACEHALAQAREPADAAWRRQADAALAGKSWQAVADAMRTLIAQVVGQALASYRRHKAQLSLAHDTAANAQAIAAE